MPTIQQRPGKTFSSLGMNHPDKKEKPGPPHSELVHYDLEAQHLPGAS